MDKIFAKSEALGNHSLHGSTEKEHEHEWEFMGRESEDSEPVSLCRGCDATKDSSGEIIGGHLPLDSNDHKEE